MKDAFRCGALAVLGLATAMVVYPTLHELGHVLAAVACGAHVEEITWLPLPSVLCRMEKKTVASVVLIGFGGMALPYLITALPPPRRFWTWYFWLLLKGITVLAFAVSVVAIGLFCAGSPIQNEDMTKIMTAAPEYATLYTVALLGAGVGSACRIVRSGPLQRCKLQFGL